MKQSCRAEYNAPRVLASERKPQREAANLRTSIKPTPGTELDSTLFLFQTPNEMCL